MQSCECIQMTSNDLSFEKCFCFFCTFRSDELRGWILWRWWAVDARGKLLDVEFTCLPNFSHSHCFISTDLHRHLHRFFVQDILHTSNPKLFPLRGGLRQQREQANRQKFKGFRCQIVINNSNVDSFDKSSYCIWIWISPIKLKLRCQGTAGSSRPWSCLFQILIWTDRRHLHSFHFPFWTLHLWRFESFCILSSDICCMLWNLYAINSIGTHHVCPETNVVDKLLEGGVAKLPDGFVSLCLCTV